MKGKSSVAVNIEDSTCSLLQETLNLVQMLINKARLMNCDTLTARF